MSNLTLVKRIEPKDWPQERIQWIWDHLKTQEYFFDDLTLGDPKVFLTLLFTPNSEHFEYNDDGYVLVNNIRPKIDATIHYAIWNRPNIRQTCSAGRELMSYLFEKYNLNRITGLIPSFNKQSIRLATLQGLRFEGALRQGHLFKGNYYDINIYGILHAEFLKLENRLWAEQQWRLEA